MHHYSDQPMTLLYVFNPDAPPLPLEEESTISSASTGPPLPLSSIYQGKLFKRYCINFETL